MNHIRNIFASHYMPSIHIWIVWLVFLIGLPLVIVAIGVRLLARRQAVWAPWKAFAIVVSLIALCSTLLLALVMSLFYIGTTAVVVIQFGEVVSLLAPVAMLVAGIILPTRPRGATPASAPF